MLFWRSENSKLNSVEPRLEYAMAHNSNPHKFSPAHREYLLVILWNPKVNMLSGESPIRKARSHYYCFTEVGNSQHSSQFAAPLNKNRTKASIAESLLIQQHYYHEDPEITRNPRTSASYLSPRVVFKETIPWSLALCEWSFRRFTYRNLVTTSPSSK